MADTLYYIHDPMCSWCWGFAPTWQRIRAGLPVDLPVTSLLGGLAPDSDAAMPAEMRRYLQHTWRHIADRLGTAFNFAFWERCQPRRATYPACRAVLAAGQQDAAEAMTTAIQHAYYLQARNPSDDGTLCELAGELGLDVARFSAALNHPDTQRALDKQIALARALGAQGFPSLVYDDGRARQLLPLDYLDAQATLDPLQRLRALRSG